MDRWYRAATLMVFVAIATPLAIAQTTPQASFSAISAHVAQPGKPVSITLLRWSTDEERAAIVAALNAPPAPADAVAPAPTEAAAGTGTAERGGTAAGGRAGRGGRGGRGRGEAAVPATPIAALTAALGKAPTLGYVWTDEVTGYSIKYAHRAPSADGGQRIILATNRVLGAQAPGWKPVGTDSPTDYEFTLIELRLNAKGRGEGKTSLTARVAVDEQARSIALENYAAAPVMLEVR